MAFVRKRIKSLSRKRHQYSIEYKLNAIAKWRELNENTSQAARHPDVNVDRQTLKGWILNEQSYRVMSNKKVAKRLRKKTKTHNAFKYEHINKKDVVQFVHPNNTAETTHQRFAPKYGSPRRTRNVSTSKTAVNSFSDLDSLYQQNSNKFQELPGRRFEDQRFENSQLNPMTCSVKPALPTHTQLRLQQHLQMAALPPPAPAPPAPRQVQVSASPVQVAVAKPKLVEKPRPREKRIFVVAEHQRCVMSNLSSLWKSGKLCDAGIGNGSSTVMVHKLILSAVCPKLLSVFNADILSHEFLQVNFPQEVSVEALNAFAEYMYNGILDLDPDILEQLKIIAKRLDMKEFEQLCDSHLPNPLHQPAAAAAASFANFPMIQTTMPISAMTSSLGSTISTSQQSAPSITTQVIDVKQEITDVELVQIQKDTAAVFGQESEVVPLAPNKSGNAAGFVICPSVKAEPVGPEDARYGQVSNTSSNQVFTVTTSPSSSTLATTAAAVFTPISSVTGSCTEFPNSFSESTDIKPLTVKSTQSYKAPLVSNLSPVANVIEIAHSKTNPVNKDPSKVSSQNDLATTSDDNAVYPIRHFSARGDKLPLLKTPLTDTITSKSFLPNEKT